MYGQKVNDEGLNRAFVSPPPLPERVPRLEDIGQTQRYVSDRLELLENRISALADRLLGHEPRAVGTLGNDAKLAQIAPTVDLLQAEARKMSCCVDRCLEELQRLETL